MIRAFGPGVKFGDHDACKTGDLPPPFVGRVERDRANGAFHTSLGQRPRFDNRKQHKG
jgi:hypothetical protein